MPFFIFTCLSFSLLTRLHLPQSFLHRMNLKHSELFLSNLLNYNTMSLTISTAQIIFKTFYFIKILKLPSERGTHPDNFPHLEICHFEMASKLKGLSLGDVKRIASFPLPSESSQTRKFLHIVSSDDDPSESKCFVKASKCLLSCPLQTRISFRFICITVFEDKE